MGGRGSFLLHCSDSATWNDHAERGLWERAIWKDDWRDYTTTIPLCKQNAFSPPPPSPLPAVKKFDFSEKSNFWGGQPMLAKDFASRRS